MTTPAGNSVYDLAFGRVKEETRKRYGKTVVKFVEWCERYGLTPTDDNQLDFCAAAYVRDLYGRSQEHKGKDSAVKLAAGLVLFCPTLKNKLNWLAAVAKGWTKAVPRLSWTPLTIEMTSLLAATLARNDKQAMAVATLVAFGGLLRISELVKLRVRDVAFGADAKLPSVAGSHFATLRLYNTKTRAHDSARIVWREAATVLRAYIIERKLKPEDKLFPFKAGSFRYHFRRACAALGFRTLGAPLVPHSLRHGGATWMHCLLDSNGKRVYSLQDVMEVGRWAVADSTRIYIKQGRTLALDNALPAAVAAAAVAAYTNVIGIFTYVLGNAAFAAVSAFEQQGAALRATGPRLAPVPATAVARRLFA